MNKTFKKYVTVENPDGTITVGIAGGPIYTLREDEEVKKDFFVKYTRVGSADRPYAGKCRHRKCLFLGSTEEEINKTAADRGWKIFYVKKVNDLEKFLAETDGDIWATHDGGLTFAPAK